MSKFLMEFLIYFCQGGVKECVLKVYNFLPNMLVSPKRYSVRAQSNINRGIKTSYYEVSCRFHQ